MKDMLTGEELRFLARYGLRPDDVYDARGLPQDHWKRAAKLENKTVALGNRCRASRHRLRTRGGHCAQCDPKKLAFQARYSADQYVYIAGSLKAGLIKVGTCSNLDQREKQIRSEKYGSAGDWIFIFTVEMHNAGEIEDRTRARLSKYAVVRPYWKDGFRQAATELLKCSFSRVMSTLMEVGAQAKFGEPWRSHRARLYEFAEPEESPA
jgi:hypothetical protein